MSGLLRIIGYIILFYFVMRILKTIFEPKNTKNILRRKDSPPPKEEFIEYEEVDER